MSAMGSMPRSVGRSIKRVNDPKLLTGSGQFVDDVALPGMVHATIIRSPLAHGRLTAFDVSDHGALLVLGPDEIGAATRPMPCVWLAEGQRITEFPVASRALLYVGEPIGIVVAESRAEAEDYAEEVDLDFEVFDQVISAEDALAEAAPVLYPGFPDNVIARVVAGHDPSVVEQVMADAAHVIERTLRIQRVAPNPLETRGVVAQWDAGDEQLTVRMTTQAPHHVRDHLAQCLGLRVEQIRVIAKDVGGGFGAKEHLYPDEVFVCLAAMRLNRPVKWIEDRVEHQTATLHGRDAVHHARLAIDAEGRFLAISTNILGNLGAHPSNVGLGPFRVSATMLPGPYRFDAVGASITAFVSNTTPTGAYRGFGMQEAAWVRERLVDEAARELGMDPVELRLMNMYNASELPVVTAMHQRYDSGDYPAALRIVATLANAKRRPSGPGNTRIRRGVGFGCHVEFTGMGPSKEQQIIGFALGGYESALVRIESDGSVIVSSGVMSMGQGIETSLAQVAADNLGVPVERVRVRLGDTSTTPYSATGSIASRSMTVGGGAVVTACQRLHQRILAIVGHQIEISPADLETVIDASGETTYRVKGDPDVSVSLRQIAERAWLNWDLPDGAEVGLEERYVHNPDHISYSYASHAAEVAVDIDTGLVSLVNYWVAHDSGVLVNPMICDGQIMGGIAQGIGIALYEEVAWSDNGQPQTITYLDYVLPLSADVPNVSIEHIETPSDFIPGGMKGLGEGGVIPAPAAIGNAIAAAVPEIAGDLVATPMSPSRLWQLMQTRGLHDE